MRDDGAVLSRPHDPAAVARVALIEVGASTVASSTTGGPDVDAARALTIDARLCSGPDWFDEV